MRLFSNKQKADYRQTLQKGISFVRGLQGGLTDETGSREENIRRLKDEIGTADAIVIGAGAGLSTAAGLTYSGERFDRYFFDFKEHFGIREHGGQGIFISTAISTRPSRFIGTCSPWSGIRIIL